MSDYTEEEQIKRVKDWWAQNGLALVLGGALGLAAIFGWRYYNSHKETVAESASDTYVELETAIAADQLDAAAQVKNTLQSDFAGTPYAGLGSLRVAQAQFDAGDYTAAAENLDWVRANADDETHRYLARLRLAKVRWAQGQPEDAALTVLESGDVPASFAPLYEEMKGDLYRAQGKTDAALDAYAAALTADAGNRTQAIEAKVKALTPPADELLVVAPAATDAEAAEGDAAAEAADADADADADAEESDGEADS